MELDKFLISLLLVGAIIVTGVAMVSDADSNYDQFNLTADENTTYATVYGLSNQIVNESYTISQDVKDQTLGGEVSTTDTAESMLRGGFSAVRLIKNSFSLIGNMFTFVAKEVGVPAYFISLALTVIVISIVFALIYLIFKR